MAMYKSFAGFRATRFALVEDGTVIHSYGPFPPGTLVRELRIVVASAVAATFGVLEWSASVRSESGTTDVEWLSGRQLFPRLAIGDNFDLTVPFSETPFRAAANVGFVSSGSLPFVLVRVGSVSAASWGFSSVVLSDPPQSVVDQVQ